MEPSITQKIIDAGIVIVPGSAFGKNAPGFARFSYATSRENLQTALDRIRSVVR
jgi:aspartate aminotransferase